MTALHLPTQGHCLIIGTPAFLVETTMRISMQSHAHERFLHPNNMAQLQNDLKLLKSEHDTPASPQVTRLILNSDFSAVTTPSHLRNLSERGVKTVLLYAVDSAEEAAQATPFPEELFSCVLRQLPTDEEARRSRVMILTPVTAELFLDEVRWWTQGSA